MHWVKQRVSGASPVLIHRPQKVTRHGIFLSWCALKSFLSAKWSSMAREDTRAAPHVALLWLLACSGHVASQDVADCTWQPQEDAVESTSLECHLKTLQTGPAVIPQVGHHASNPRIPWPSVVYLLVSLDPALNVWEGRHAIEQAWALLYSDLATAFYPSLSCLGFGLGICQSVLFELTAKRPRTKKVFFLIWQSTNVVICFGQVKSYARLDSELTLIFRRLPARP